MSDRTARGAEDGDAAAIDRDRVLDIAHLARLRLDDDEADLFARQLNDILAHAQEIADSEASAAGDSIVFRENVLPVMEAGQAELVELDHEIDHGIRFEPTVGHTPGHVAVALASKGARAVMSGDLIHSPLQLAFPEWSPRVDWDRARSAQTRRRFLEQHADTDTVVMTAHFPQPSMGQVVSAGSAFRFRYRAA